MIFQNNPENISNDDETQRKLNHFSWYQIHDDILNEWDNEGCKKVYSNILSIVMANSFYIYVENRYYNEIPSIIWLKEAASNKKRTETFRQNKSFCDSLFNTVFCHHFEDLSLYKISQTDDLFYLHKIICGICDAFAHESKRRIMFSEKLPDQNTVSDVYVYTPLYENVMNDISSYEGKYISPSTIYINTNGEIYSIFSGMYSDLDSKLHVINGKITQHEAKASNDKIIAIIFISKEFSESIQFQPQRILNYVHPDKEEIICYSSERLKFYQFQEDIPNFNIIGPRKEIREEVFTRQKQRIDKINNENHLLYLFDKVFNVFPSIEMNGTDDKSYLEILIDDQTSIPSNHYSQLLWVFDPTGDSNRGCTYYPILIPLNKGSKSIISDIKKLGSKLEFFKLVKIENHQIVCYFDMDRADIQLPLDPFVLMKVIAGHEKKISAINTNVKVSISLAIKSEEQQNLIYYGLPLLFYEYYNWENIEQKYIDSIMKLYGDKDRIFEGYNKSFYFYAEKAGKWAEANQDNFSLLAPGTSFVNLFVKVVCITDRIYLYDERLLNNNETFNNIVRNQ